MHTGSDGTLAKRHTPGMSKAFARASRTKPLPEGDDAHGLPKCLKTRDVVGFGLGVTVGAGVFMATGKAAQEAGPAVTLAFLVAAVGCSCTGLCYAELAALAPSSGSSYTFVYHAAGELPACLVGLTNIVNAVLSSAAVARGWEGYLRLFLLSMGLPPPNFMEGFAWGPLQVSVLAPLLIVVVVAINLCGTLAISSFNNVVTFLSVSLLIGYVCGGAAQVNPDLWAPYAPNGAEGIAKGAGSVFFAYIGFDVLATLGAESVNERVVPCGIVMTLLVTTCLYCGVGAVFTGLVDTSDIDMTAPLARAAEQNGLPFLALVVSIGALGNTLTTVIGSIVAIPRYCLSMAQDGLLPTTLVRINRFGAPARSLIVMAGPAVVIAAFFDFSAIADVVSAGALGTFALVCASLVLLRCPRAWDAGASRREESANSEEEDGDCGPWKVQPAAPRSVVLGMTSFVVLTFILGVLFRVPMGGTAWLSKVLLAFVGFCTAIAACVVALPFLCRDAGAHVRAETTHRAGHFQLPLMPLLPMLGMFMNVLLASQMDWLTLIEAAVVQSIGAAFYFGYSAQRSHLNKPSTKVWKPVFDCTVPPEEVNQS
mmetsp:Transcript_6955/g.16387  ORF Transcript_6955/g.16387 Transcript_6955/m.16387 type:complete len:595 (+) Transcript_6955:28-1812(+)